MKTSTPRRDPSRSPTVPLSRRGDMFDASTAGGPQRSVGSAGQRPVPTLLRRFVKAPAPSSPLGAAAAVGFTAAALLLGSPAVAAPLEDGSFDEDFAFTVDDFCAVDGLTVLIEGSITGRYTVGSHGDGQAYFRQRSVVERTVTNVDTGASYTDKASTLDKDLRITENDDGGLIILVLATGNSTVYDSSGKAIARNPGQVRFELVLDDAGEQVSFTIVKESTGRSDDLCAAVVPVLT